MEKYSMKQGKKYTLDYQSRDSLLEEIRIGHYYAIHHSQMDDEMYKYYKAELEGYERYEEQRMIEEAEMMNDPDYWDHYYDQYIDTLDEGQIEIVEELKQQDTTPNCDKSNILDKTGYGDYETDEFQIQIATEIVRDSGLDKAAFTLYVILVGQWSKQKKPDTFTIDRNKLCYLMGLKDRTLKKHYNQLFERGYVLNEIKAWKRDGSIDVAINDKFDPQGKRKFFYAQLTHNVINKHVLDKIGFIGVRMLYYYKSYINLSNNKVYAYPKIDDTVRDIGCSRNTVDDGNDILEKVRFIKIERNYLHTEYNYDDNHNLIYWKWNNKYYVRQKKIDMFVEKMYQKKQA